MWNPFKKSILYRLYFKTISRMTIEAYSDEEAEKVRADYEREQNSHCHHGEVVTVLLRKPTEEELTSSEPLAEEYERYYP